jgi:hypothetical protein
MPRVRYGPDITDDADSILLDDSRIKNQLKGATGAKRAKLLKEKDVINKAIKDVFGSRKNARKLAAESVRRQGYMSDADARAIGAKRNRKLKGKGALGLAATPGRGSQQIGRKKGYKVRQGTNNEDLFKSATAKARSSEVMRRVRAQKTAAQSSKSKAKKAAKKVSGAKKATAVKKAAKKTVPAKKAAVKKVATPAKKAVPRKKR